MGLKENRKERTALKKGSSICKRRKQVRHKSGVSFLEGTLYWSSLSTKTTLCFFGGGHFETNSSRDTSGVSFLREPLLVSFKGKPRGIPHVVGFPNFEPNPFGGSPNMNFTSFGVDNSKWDWRFGG